MKLEVDVISEVLIKPSCPTPHHLRRYTLSFIDQITVHIYAPALYFYQSNGDPDFAAAFQRRLQTSLSALLTHYPPLAGRPNYAASFVDCNDAGVPFREAVTGSTLSDVVHHATPDDLNRLFPVELDRCNDELMMVQFTELACGGVAVACCVSHKIADAMTLFSLNNNWAALARGVKDAFRPHLEGAKLFPPKTATYDTTMTIVRNRVARRFVFVGSQVEAIRAKYEESGAMGNQRRPSRVEALVAFVYSRFLAAIRDDANSPLPTDRTYLVNYPVNLRPKMEPPLPHDAFGNYYYNAMIFPSPDTLNNDQNCYSLVKQLREEADKINAQSANHILNETPSIMDTVKDVASKFLKGDIVSCAFTSICRFPLYDADFGWGRPALVTFPALWFKNLVALMDATDGRSIHATLHFEDRVMAKFQSDHHFLKYATPHPATSNSL